MIDFSEILEKIENLSLSSEKQIKYLKDLGTYPSLEELALEFDDAYRPLKGRVSEVIEKLNFLLDKLSDSEDVNIWETSSLNSAPWLEIRELSRNILLKIHLLRK